MRSCWLVVAGLVLAFPGGTHSACADTVIVDFNSANDVSRFVSVEPDIEHVMDGIAGSGAVRMTQGASALLFEEQQFALSSDHHEIATSVMFRYREVAVLSNGGGIGAVIASLYVFPDNSPLFPTDYLSTSYEISQATPASPILHTMYLFSRQAGSTAGQGFPIGALTDNHWYRLSTTFFFSDAAGSFHNGFDMKLEDFGVDGLSLVGTNFQQSADAVFAPEMRDESVWVGFGMGRPRGKGADPVDNFTVAGVPEPAALSLMMGVFGVAATGLRRR